MHILVAITHFDKRSNICLYLNKKNCCFHCFVYSANVNIRVRLEYRRDNLYLTRDLKFKATATAAISNYLILFVLLFCVCAYIDRILKCPSAIVTY